MAQTKNTSWVHRTFKTAPLLMACVTISNAAAMQRETEVNETDPTHTHTLVDVRVVDRYLGPASTPSGVAYAHLDVAAYAEQYGPLVNPVRLQHMFLSNQENGAHQDVGISVLQVLPDDAVGASTTSGHAPANSPISSSARGTQQSSDPQQEAVLSHLQKHGIKAADIADAIENSDWATLTHITADPVNHALFEAAADGAGNTPVHFAANEQDPALLAYVLRYVSNVRNALTRDANGDTPVSIATHRAAESGDLQVLEMIMSYFPEGAFLESPAQSQKIPPHVAAQKGHIHVLEYFRTHAPSKDKMLEIRTQNYSTAHYAALGETTDALEYLTTLPNRQALCTPFLKDALFVRMHKFSKLVEVVRAWLSLTDFKEELTTLQSADDTYRARLDTRISEQQAEIKRLKEAYQKEKTS